MSKPHEYIFQDEYFCIRSIHSFVLIGRVLIPFTLFIETAHEEYCQYLITGDLVAVSAPEGGDLNQAIILLELIREYHAPLIVLPKGHPGSKRLKMVVSAGERIEMSCSIQRGTHPEQHFLCGSDDMSGLGIQKSDEGLIITNMKDLVKIELIPRKGDYFR